MQNKDWTSARRPVTVNILFEVNATAELPQTAISRDNAPHRKEIFADQLIADGSKNSNTSTRNSWRASDTAYRLC